MERIGMRREAHLREHLWQRGAWRDSFLYAILENEWKAAHPT
jgi:RimJ/RimL family protein N-acetyltransferase